MRGLSLTKYDSENCTQTESNTLPLETGLLETTLNIAAMKDKHGLKGKGVGYHN